MNSRSKDRLAGVHPDLVRVVEEASAHGAPFEVIEGRRSLERQVELVSEGHSRTMRSRHLTGHAVDLAVIIDGVARWDWPSYRMLAAVMKASARTLGVPLEWGGDWTSFKDGPHFQLPWSEYPGGEDIGAGGKGEVTA